MGWNRHPHPNPVAVYHVGVNAKEAPRTRDTSAAQGPGLFCIRPSRRARRPATAARDRPRFLSMPRSPSRSRATFPASRLLWRGMSRRHPHPHPVVPVAVVWVVPVANRTASVPLIVDEGAAPQHAAVSGRPRRPARTGQRPNYTPKPQNSPVATRLRRDLTGRSLRSRQRTEFQSVREQRSQSLEKGEKGAAATPTRTPRYLRRLSG
jgi:hypothetical protein